MKVSPDWRRQTLLAFPDAALAAVHERDMDTDLLLTVLKTLLVQRRNSGGAPLRLVLMSATVNAQLFSDYFDGAPILNIPGRLYPVNRRYLDEIVPEVQRPRGRPLPLNEGGWVFQVTSLPDLRGDARTDG
jgi:HrpA-like RNA helicase